MFSPNLGRWVTMDPIGYDAGDPNLYGYVGNNPGTGLDPSGLAEVPTVVWGAGNGNSLAGKFAWFVPSPTSPNGLKILTHVDIRFSTTRGECPAATHASYAFWFQGKLDLGKLEVNLIPVHGSHAGTRNETEPWPIFNGRTPKDKKAQLQDYIEDAYKTFGSRGQLTVLVEYRGYKIDPTETFKPRITTGEFGGPVEFPQMYINPTKPEEKRHTIPNCSAFPYAMTNRGSRPSQRSGPTSTRTGPTLPS